MAYTFDPVFAVDPNNPANVAKNASITIFDPADVTQAPITITDPTGVPLDNPITVDAAGMGPAYQHPTLARVGWKGAGFTGYFTSYEGMYNETQEAKAAAQEAASLANAAAGTTVTSAVVDGSGRLILTKADASLVDAGVVVGPAGAPGLKGADGSNVLPTDTAIRDAINNAASETRAALNGAYAGSRPTADTEGTAYANLAAGSTATVVLTGHSQVYGQEIGGTGAPVNGSSTARSATPIPESLQDVLNAVIPGKVTVVNQGYPGDTTTASLNRWASGTSGDVEFIWLESNDFVSSLPMETTVANTVALIDRSLARGSQPVIIGGHSNYGAADAGARRARYQAMARVAAKMGVPFINVSSLLNGLGTGRVTQSDGTHLTAAAYACVGVRLAAFLGPLGINPAKVGPGNTVYPLNHYFRGTYTTPDRTTNTRDSFTIKIDAGQKVMLTVDANAPTDPIISFYASPSVGQGTGRIRYANGLTAIADRHFSIAGVGSSNGRSTRVRAQTLPGGPDVLVIECTTGSIEIDAIDFVAPYAGPTTYAASAKKLVRSTIAGSTIGVTQAATGATSESIVDANSPVSLLDSAGAGATARIDYDVVFPDGAALFATSSTSASEPLSIYGGYFIARATTGLQIRLANGTRSTIETVAGVFTDATTPFVGRFTFSFAADGTLTILKDGVQVGATVAATWKHYYPGAYAANGKPLTIRACTVVGDKNAV